mgnify:CR=1 FL=1
MNIKQNIVCIKTATQMGTGIILPCENKKNEEISPNLSNDDSRISLSDHHKLYYFN